VDIVVEATGSGTSPSLGLNALRPRGTLVVFSYIWKPEILDMGLIHMKELNLPGSCRSGDTFESSLKLMAEGRIDTEALVDLAVPLEDYEQPLTRLSEDKAHTFKVVFTPVS
jgi:threonine dehydrogenase-like Zn-dependent dehydrogenase